MKQRKPIRIHVTQSDINDTVQSDPHACMVWSALARQLDLPETGYGIHVGYDAITISRKANKKLGVRAKKLRVANDTNTNTRIRHFDVDRKWVKPFDFDFNLPADWREQIENG